LLRARYPVFPAGTERIGYPEKYGPAALRGRLVHAALEAYGRSLPDAVSSPFDARAFLKQWLRKWQTQERNSNPRIDIEALRARLSLDEGMAEFRALASHVPGSVARDCAGPGVKSPARLRPPPDAPEYSLAVDDPPLKGRIDRVKDGRVIDFKTGSFDEEHGDQLRFYALLWWLKFGEPPAGLELLYTDTSTATVVPVPSPEEMKHLAHHYREQVHNLRTALAAPPVPARPSAETCATCPVRQLCPEYWTAAVTETLRSPNQDTNDVLAYRDVHLTRVPRLPVSGPLTGDAEATGFGAVAVLIPRGKCPPSSGGLPLAAYLLGARVERTASGWRIGLPLAGEIFWELADAEQASKSQP
jgi:hypothetical protein